VICAIILLESRAIVGTVLMFACTFDMCIKLPKTARCRCNLRHVPKFTAASRGPLCNSTAFLLYALPIVTTDMYVGCWNQLPTCIRESNTSFYRHSSIV